jgi:hypothetical protein
MMMMMMMMMPGDEQPGYRRRRPDEMLESASLEAFSLGAGLDPSPRLSPTPENPTTTAISGLFSQRPRVA